MLTALRGLALGRIVLGAAALAAPDALARAFGIHPTPELRYMTRIFGARGMVLGLGYLTASPADRPRWQRLALLVDTIDTAHGTAHIARNDVPRTASLPLVLLTGSYMSLGAARLAQDLT
jgi:hypothetical protein